MNKMGGQTSALELNGANNPKAVAAEKLLRRHSTSENARVLNAQKDEPIASNIKYMGK